MRATEQGFSLPPFYAEEWQQRSSAGDSDFVGSLPMDARAAAWSARFCRGEATAEEFLHEIDRLPIALGNSHDFLIRRASSEGFDAPAIDGDGKRTITVHNAGQISEIDFVHEEIACETTTTCKYFYDAEAVKEKDDQPTGAAELTAQHKQSALGCDLSSSTLGSNYGPSQRNMRDVWYLGPEPFPEAHFATFVTEIPRRDPRRNQRHGRLPEVRRAVGADRGKEIRGADCCPPRTRH